MATPERIPASSRLVKAADAERAKLRRRLDRAERLTGALREKLEHAERQAEEIRQRLVLLDEVAGPQEGDERDESEQNLVDFPHSSREPEEGYLRGASIRTVSVRLLANSPQHAAPIHYTDWYAIVLDAGYGITGRDPLTTFLTQINRSPVVARSQAPGTYQLDLEAPAALRGHLVWLNHELLSLHNGQQTIEAITSARERRAELIAEINRTERELEEALEALGSAPGGHDCASDTEL